MSWLGVWECGGWGDRRWDMLNYTLCSVTLSCCDVVWEVIFKALVWLMWMV